MSTPFQNRLVGTVIVAAVVIIFLPDVLDGEKKSHQADFEAIPQVESFSGELTDKPFPEERLIRQRPAPVIDESAMDNEVIINPAVVAKTAIENVSAKAKITEKNVKIKSPQPKQASKLPEKAIASEAWVIHLGSFKNKDNVDHLVKKLKANDYIVFTKPIKTKQGTLTKVIIGPELIKSAMVKKLTKLKQLTNIQGKVASFEIK